MSFGIDWLFWGMFGLAAIPIALKALFVVVIGFSSICCEIWHEFRG